MTSTRKLLRDVSSNVEESMGVRTTESRPRLSPVASSKDIGRTPLRRFGQLDLSRIVRDESQPRQQFDDEEIQRLASSIRDDGQIQPIGVRWSPDEQVWIVLTGERRWRAAQVAGLDKIDCYFQEDELGTSDILKRQLVENLLRQDLKPMEEARGYATLMELNEWNGKQVAEALSVHPSRVSRGLNLLELPADVQDRIESGEISRSLAYELIKLDNEDVQRELAENAANGAISQRQASKAVRQRRGKATRTSGRTTLKFKCEHVIQVSIQVNRGSNYHEVEAALSQTIEEVRLRIRGNIQI